jgi:pyridoxamine 5'-phosphate oxidase
MVLQKISQRRKAYSGIVIPKITDPKKLFNKWLSDAIKTSNHEPNAMALSTVSNNGQPRSRFVLLKGINKESFEFFTNTTSSKAKEISKNRKASLLFYWPEIHRQIRIEGTIKKLSRRDTEKYFSTRPFGSKIAALISNQSSKLESRELLIKQYKLAETKYKNSSVPTPINWSGYCLVPKYFEFWSGMPSRLHDRVYFQKLKNNIWKSGRMYP